MGNIEVCVTGSRDPAGLSESSVFIAVKISLLRLSLLSLTSFFQRVTEMCEK